MAIRKIHTQPVKIKSIDEFLKLIREEDLDDYALFRGQEGDWPLLPKIGRLLNDKKLCNDDFLKAEIEMLNDFKRLSLPYLNRTPQNDWEWLSLAQHQGMATRLLDWTTNPLTALWFAVSKSNKNELGVIWLCNPPKESVLKPNDIEIKKDNKTQTPFNQNYTVVFQPNISSNRIAAQNGWFTIHRYSKKENKFIRFEWNKRYKDGLKKFTIDKKYFSDMRAELDRLGINKLSLFPDIDGVAAYSEWLHSLLDDEIKRSPKRIRVKKRLSNSR